MSIIIQNIFKLLCLFSLSIVAVTFGSFSNAQVNEKYASIVVNASSGEIYRSRNSRTALNPAGLTKLMTLYVVFDALRNNKVNLDTSVIVSQNVINTRKIFNNKIPIVGLKEGQTATIGDLIIATALTDANDAALVLAEAIAGTERNFVNKMNLTAKTLGMFSTSFADAHGMSQFGFSSAQDMAILGQRLISTFPDHFHLLSRRTYSTHFGRLTNKNTTLLNTIKGLDGAKSGYNKSSGYNFFTTVKRGNDRLIVVVFGGKSPHTGRTEVTRLIDIGYARLRDKEALALRDDSLSWPLKGKIIQRYKKGSNNGIHLSAVGGTPVKSAAIGRVVAINKDDENREILTLQHLEDRSFNRDGTSSIYANLTDVVVQKGDLVQKGQIIAHLSNLQPSFLYFEIRKGIENVDPEKYLSGYQPPRLESVSTSTTPNSNLKVEKVSTSTDVIDSEVPVEQTKVDRNKCVGPVSTWTNCYGNYTNANGSKYVGEFKGGLFDGFGTVEDAAGMVWTGHWLRGFPMREKNKPNCTGSFTRSTWTDCFGEINLPYGDNYIGNFFNGQPSGVGILSFSDSTYYLGYFSKGKYDGAGLITLKDNQEYFGTFKDTTPNKGGNYSQGQGTFTSETGAVYIGDFKNAKPHGRGTFSYPGGSRYEGYWVDGLEHGQGHLIRNNGDTYVGEFYEGKYHGKGTLTILASGNIKRGFWKHGSFQYASKLASGVDQNKVALLIGNSKYNHTVKLTNPSNDVELLKIALRSIGFSVDTLLDANKSEMEDAILTFGENASISDISLLFYAGHSIESKGLNYLLPVDADIKSEGHLPVKSTALNWILDQVNSTKVLSIILLDACRDNPFSDKMYNVKSRSTASRGLAKVRVNGNQFIGFSASPGQVASDGRGQSSPYAKALAKHITSEDEISILFRKIKTEVQKSTSGLQVPYVENNLGADMIYLFK